MATPEMELGLLPVYTNGQRKATAATPDNSRIEGSVR